MAKQSYIVFFEGADGCGKSTLRKVFAEATEEKHLAFDRGPASNWTYDQLIRGVTDKKALWRWIEVPIRMAQIMPVLIVVVSLTPNAEDWRADKLFRAYLEELPLDDSLTTLLFLNDFKKSPVENAKRLIENLKKKGILV